MKSTYIVLVTSYCIGDEDRGDKNGGNSEVRAEG